MKFITSTRKKLDDFFSVPHDPRPLGLYRVLISAFVILQAVLWYADWQAFFGPDAWIQWEISKAMVPELTIHISHVAAFFSWFGLNDEQAVNLFFWIYIVSATGMLIGYYTRVWAVLTWFCHYVMLCSIDVYVYGVDIFLQISLFYLMIMPIARAFSLDAFFKRIDTSPHWRVTLSLRVFQLHMCLIYLSSGFEKMQSPYWWDGNVIWRSLVQPDFSQYNVTWLAQYPWIVMLLSWFTIICEAGYCFAMWIPKLRVFWLVAIIMLHAGIAVFLGLWLFGLIMILLSVSAFGFDCWKDIKAWQKKKHAQANSAFAIA